LPFDRFFHLVLLGESPS